MIKTLKVICVVGLLGSAVTLSASPPAFAISAELANKCRALAIKAYPRKLAGKKSGTATAERKYFRDCVAKGGAVPENNTSDTPATTPAAK